MPPLCSTNSPDRIDNLSASPSPQFADPGLRRFIRLPEQHRATKRSQLLIGATRALAIAMLASCLAATCQAQSVEWIKQFGTSSQDQGYGISADGQGTVYVTGYDSNKPFLRRYDDAGQILWTDSPNVLPPAYDNYNAVAADAAGRIYVAHALGGVFNGVNDVAVSRHGANGTRIWSRTFGTTSTEYAYGVAIDPSGNALITGFTDGSLVAPINGYSDGFVRKYDENGNELWTRQFGTDSYEWGFRVTTDRLGNVFVAGYTDGSLADQNQGLSDAVLVKFDPAGNLLWSRQPGRSASDYSTGVATDAIGNS